MGKKEKNVPPEARKLRDVTGGVCKKEFDKFTAIVNGPEGSPVFDLSSNEALDAAVDLARCETQNGVTPPLGLQKMVEEAQQRPQAPSGPGSGPK